MHIQNVAANLPSFLKWLSLLISLLLSTFALSIEQSGYHPGGPRVPDMNLGEVAVESCQDIDWSMRIMTNFLAP